MLRKIFLITGLFISIIAPVFAVQPAVASTSLILITEVQTRHFDTTFRYDFAQKEFIEIANISDQSIDMHNWTLEYMPGTYDGTKPGTTLLTINGSLPAGGHAIFNHPDYRLDFSDGLLTDKTGENSGLLAKTAGHARLLNGSAVVDCVSWGSAKNIEGCTRLAAYAPDSHTLQRPKNEAGQYDASLGLQNLSPPTPEGGQLEPFIVEEPEQPDQEDPPILNPPATDCSVIQLSEVLPNPAGSDAEGEYIELYNPTIKNIKLTGCSLQIGSRVFAFNDTHVMAAVEYKAFYFSTTGLQLPNSGGEIWLFTPSVQSSLTYPASADDQLWSLIDGQWQTTFHATPNAPNQLLTKGGAGVAAQLASAIEPCPEGKFRNPETNRCKNIEIAAVQAACPAGQERNPDTGRCRKIPTPTVPAACGVGQERNPETGRCRKIGAATSTPAACAPGQERNPETNRCRKVAGASTTKTTTTNNSGGGGSVSYKILAGVLVLVAGYGVYEYRQDLLKLMKRAKSLVFSRSTSQ